MARIFTWLAVAAMVLLGAALALGFWVGDYNAAADQLRTAAQEDNYLAAEREVAPVLARQTWHFLCGVLAVLVTVLVNSISVTYFIGTSRWSREVVEAYSLDPQFVERANRIKRGCFPWALLGMLTALAIAALGGASDPVTGIRDTQRWVTWHYLTALVGTGVIGWSFFSQVGRLQAHQRLIHEILAEVRRVRSEHGLEVE